MSSYARKRYESVDSDKDQKFSDDESPHGYDWLLSAMLENILDIKGVGNTVDGKKDLYNGNFISSFAPQERKTSESSTSSQKLDFVTPSKSQTQSMDVRSYSPYSDQEFSPESERCSFSSSSRSPTIEEAILMGCNSCRSGASVSSRFKPGTSSNDSYDTYLDSIFYNSNRSSFPRVPLALPYQKYGDLPPYLFTLPVLYDIFPSDYLGMDLPFKLFNERDSGIKSDSSCTWSGSLPFKTQENPSYSRKLFVGGVPWDVTEMELIDAFAHFGSVKVQWPSRDIQNAFQQKAGYVYIIFEWEKQVDLLLKSCSKRDSTCCPKWFYRVSSRRLKSKEVQIIPWIIGDNIYIRCPSQKLDANRTVFVGGLHGMMTAEGLAQVMNDLFGGVIYAGIDTDKYHYPLGSGKVTFSSRRSYMKAVAACFVEVKAADFQKKIQVDPYLEDSVCSVCQVQRGTVFCRSFSCFRYFCNWCWNWQHSLVNTTDHKPLSLKKMQFQ